MFTEMLNSLKQDKIPALLTIKGRLNIALIKKEAVLQLPKTFRVSDPKINPRSDHMVWAAILLQDQELFEITSAIFLTEHSINNPNKKTTKACHTDIIRTILKDLLEIPQQKLTKTSINNGLKKISNFNLLP